MANKLNKAKEPTGKPRGRPAAKNSKGPYVPTGKPRGRPAGDNPRPAYVPTGRPRGRQPGQVGKKNKQGAHLKKKTEEVAE